MKTKFILLIISIIIIGLFVWIWLSSKPSFKPNLNVNPSTLPGIQTTLGPWPAETTKLKQRLSVLGLPALLQEGTVLHTHQHLDLYIQGQKIEVPANIGIDEQAGFSAPIHTHDTTGIIHVESPVNAPFYLGQFFDIWGVSFTSQCIGGYCQGNGNNLSVYVNGNLYNGDPRKLELESHQEIVVIFGTDSQKPKPIPSSFDFPSGY